MTPPTLPESCIRSELFCCLEVRSQSEGIPVDGKAASRIPSCESNRECLDFFVGLAHGERNLVDILGGSMICTPLAGLGVENEVPGFGRHLFQEETIGTGLDPGVSKLNICAHLDHSGLVLPKTPGLSILELAQHIAPL